MSAEIWQQQFAELLECDNRPGAIAAAIENLKSECQQLRNKLVVDVAQATIQTRDDMIRAFRRTSVNCGRSSQCAVSGWFQLSTESN